jgi:hypothetical protein
MCIYPTHHSKSKEVKRISTPLFVSEIGTGLTKKHPHKSIGSGEMNGERCGGKVTWWKVGY